MTVPHARFSGNFQFQLQTLAGTKQNVTFHPKPSIILTSMAESCSSLSPCRHCADGKLEDSVAYLKLKDCRDHYFQNPDSFHMDGSLYEHCDYHWTKSYFHRNYKLLIRKLAIDVMLYSRAFLVQRKRKEDHITVEVEFSGYLGKKDFVPSKNKQFKDTKCCQVSRNMIKNRIPQHTFYFSTSIIVKMSHFIHV